MYQKCRLDSLDSDSIIVKKTQSKRIPIGNKAHRLCRFCGRYKNDGATFRSTAHAIPESTGNKWLISYHECDDCNSFFDKSIENDFGKRNELFHTFQGVEGKKGKKATECLYRKAD